MIGGFIISGDVAKSVVIRALGPSLTAAGVKRVLADPVLELYNAAGSLVEANDNWSSVPAGTVPDALKPAFPAEAVIAATLSPGSYTAVVRGAGGTNGNALGEIYDLEPGNSSIRNISTRGEVGQGDDVMIAGFIVAGTSPAKVVLRAMGPSLTAAGLTGALANPLLELRDSHGSLIFQNDDWRSTQAKALLAAGVAPGDDRESAIIATLPPGIYTAIVRGSGGTSGVALVEVYALD